MAEASLVRNFHEAIERWNDITEQWEVVTEIDGGLVYYTQPSSILRLRVNLEHKNLRDMWLSDNYIQWHVETGVVVNGNNMYYDYKTPGVYEIKIYIARSDGKVITLGKGNQESVSVTVKNVLHTHVRAEPQGVSGNNVGEWNELIEKIQYGDKEYEEFHGYRVNMSAGKVSIPISINSFCSWQMYNPDHDQEISLYAEAAGLVFSTDQVRGNESAPLLTTSYMDNKYAQFQKTWRFTSDSTGQAPISSVSIPGTKIYVKKTGWTYEICEESDPDAEFTGVSGVSDIHYIDDSAAVFVGENRFTYRLEFQMNSQNWPGSYNYTHLPQELFTDDPEHIQTPGYMVAPTDYVWARVEPAEYDQVMFTTTGIDGHIITKNKFQNSPISFVMSVGDEAGRIIKHAKPIIPSFWYWSASADYSSPSIPDFAELPLHAYVVTLSSDSDYDPAAISIKLDDNLSAIEQYSSIAFVLSSTQSINNVKLTGFIKTVDGVLTGESGEFDILPDTGKYTFFKHGEEIDHGGVINSSVLQENINQHERLEAMINSIFGRYEDIPTALGKTIYEKIKNFVGNNSDIDECNIKSIYGLAAEVNQQLQDYDLSYPGSVKRLVDMLSVGIRRLTGTRNIYQDDFYDETTITPEGRVTYGRNIGDTPLDTTTYIVTAGVPIVAREIFGNNKFKIIPAYVTGDSTSPGYTTMYGMNGLSSYPLSSYQDDWNWGLTYDPKNIFSDYYEFYEYIDNSSRPMEDFEQLSGTINWDGMKDIQNLSVLSETVTSYSDWFGDGGVVETCIEHSLHSGLKAIT